MATRNARIELLFAVYNKEQVKLSDTTSQEIPLSENSLVRGAVIPGKIGGYYQDPDYPEFLAVCIDGSWVNVKVDIDVFERMLDGAN